MKFVYIDFCWSFCCTTPFIFMLIIVKKTCSNHVVNSSVVYLFISIDIWVIATSSFHGYTCRKAPITSVIILLFMRWKVFVVRFNFWLFPDYDSVFKHKYQYLKKYFSFSLIFRIIFASIFIKSFIHAFLWCFCHFILASVNALYDAH